VELVSPFARDDSLTRGLNIWSESRHLILLPTTFMQMHTSSMLVVSSEDRLGGSGVGPRSRTRLRYRQVLQIWRAEHLISLQPVIVTFISYNTVTGARGEQWCISVSRICEPISAILLLQGLSVLACSLHSSVLRKCRRSPCVCCCRHTSTHLCSLTLAHKSPPVRLFCQLHLT
jgi:hypothetical protein